MLAALVAFALRLAALHYAWRAPRAWRTPTLASSELPYERAPSKQPQP